MYCTDDCRCGVKKPCKNCSGEHGPTRRVIIPTGAHETALPDGTTVNGTLDDFVDLSEHLGQDGDSVVVAMGDA